jgi:hypothetical protein
MKKFNIFLTVVIGLAAFMTGYLLVSGGIYGQNKKTGTILDKFEDTASVSEKTPQIDTKGPTLATEKNIVSAVNYSADTVAYYEKNTGKIFKYNLNSHAEESLSDKILPNFMSSVWSPDKNEAVRSFYSQNGFNLSYYNLSTQKSLNLPGSVKSVAFSPDGNLIVFYQFQSENSVGKIILSQPDGSYQKTILNTRIEDPQISWPGKDRIAIKTKAADIFILTQDGKLTRLLEAKAFLEDKWSPSGNKLLFSAVDPMSEDKNSMLFLEDVDSKAEQPLSIKGDASKCGWSIDEFTVYCAIPSTPSTDEIFKINLKDNTMKSVAELNVAVKDLFISGLDDYIVFTSTQDNLYSIKIPE